MTKNEKGIFKLKTISTIILSCFLLVSCASSKNVKEAKFKTYVINLDRAPERLKYMNSLLDMHFIEFERVRAVDGYEINITDKETGEVFKGVDIKTEKVILKDNHEYFIDCGRDKEINYIHNTKIRKLSPGEMGCTCSHRSIYLDFINSDNDYAVIFEDDLKIKNKEFLFLLHSALNNMTPSSIVYMDAWGHNIDGIKRNDGTGNLFIKLESGPRIFGLYAVIIGKKTAKVLLSKGNVEYEPIDIRVGEEIVNKTISGYLLNKRAASFFGSFGSEINNMGRHH